MAQLSFTNVAGLEVWRNLSSPLWIFDVEPQRIWWANDSGLEFWRARTIEELRAREYSTDSATVLERLTAILDILPETGSFHDNWTLYPDGEPQTVVLSFQRARLENNREGLLVEVVQLRDAAMDAAATRIAEAAQTTSSMITMMSIEGRILVQNPAALKCYGPPLPHGSHQLDIHARFPDPDISQQVLAGVMENKVIRFRTEVETRLGSRVHYVWIKRGRDPVTGNPVIAISEEDISEITELYHDEIKRSAELEDIVEDHTNRLRVSQERMRRGLQLAAIWDWDIAANTLFFSPNFIRLLGYEKAEFYEKLRVKEFEGLIHPEDFRPYPAKLAKILANPDQPLSLELRFLTKSGEYLWIQIEGVCYCGENGKPFRTAGLLTDITRKKQLETKLVASQKLEAIGQLTGGIAHDFNNLLTVIQGNIQLLQEMGQADEELTQEIVTAVQRGANLTRHLLAFAGKQSLDPAPLDVAELLTRMRDTLLRILSGAIETVFKAPDDLWPVFADAVQTEAALLNIALNARDAMTKGGTLKITAQNLVIDHANAPPATDLKSGQYVRISVSDTGSGMTPDVIVKAFEPFFTTKGVGEGSGLGLSMVLGFSQQSGGDAQIESEVGTGTTISIYLPRAEHIPDTENQNVTSAPQRGNAEHIHILEDNSQVVTAVTRMATSLGYTATASLSVEAALEIATQDDTITVFLIDVILPGGRSGVDFALELLKIRPKAKLILMSGYPDGELVRDITQSFSFGFLPKPFNRSDLADAIASALNQ